MTRQRISYAFLGSLTLMLAAQSSLACLHQATRHAKVPTEGISIIEIAATSGDLRIQGKEGLSEITIDGIACADDENQLPNIQISSQRIDERLRLVAEVPFETNQDWRVGYLDLTLDVPTTIPLQLSDSSGDIKVADVASLTLSDSSGAIDLRRVAGEVLILRDSSGDIGMQDVGPVIIRIDSSGEIRIKHAESVVVELDTSGDIEISDVRGDVSVGTDSSGSIEVDGVGGDFSVADDSSGGIHYRRVAGRVNIPSERGQGSP